MVDRFNAFYGGPARPPRPPVAAVPDAWSAVGHGAAAAFGLVVVLVLLVLVRRGRRVGDHPHCRRCGFDLFGTPDTTTRCNECGADLNARKAVRVGERRPRTLLKLAAVAVLGVAVWQGVDFGRQAAAGVAWHTLKPLAWQLDDAESRDATTRVRAMRIIQNRADAGALTKADRRRVTRRALGVQADPKRKWYGWWHDWVVRERGRGRVNDEQWEAFVRRQVPARFVLDVRPRVDPEWGLPFRLRPLPATRHQGIGWADFADVPPGDVLTIDGREVPEVVSFETFGVHSLWDDITRRANLASANLSPGRHELRVRGQRKATYGGDDKYAVMLDVDAAASFEVVPTGASDLYVYDANASDRDRQRLHTALVRRSGNWVSVRVFFLHPGPANGVAAEVWLRVGSRKWLLDSRVVYPHPRRVETTFRAEFAASLPDLPADLAAVDVIVGPDPFSAVRTIDVDDVPGERMIAGVPVVRVPALPMTGVPQGRP